MRVIDLIFLILLIAILVVVVKTGLGLKNVQEGAEKVIGKVDRGLSKFGLF